MILKFLYQTDARERKIISGLVEDNSESTYDPFKTFPVVDESKAIITDGQNAIYNKGKQGYMVFHFEEEDKYLDVNLFNGEVKIALTKNISHASCYSEEFFGAILDYADYFDCDDIEFIYSGLKKSKMGLEDEYDHFFKKLQDASYCKINMDDNAYFLCRDDEQKYYLSRDFSLASKIAKNEIRRVLVINDYIDKSTKRSDLSFSPFKALSEDNSYYYAGLNPFKATYNDDILKVELDPVVSINARLIRSEEIFLNLKDVSYLISKEKNNKRYYLEVGNKYIKEESPLSYSLVSNPYEATPILDYDIEIIKSLLKVFDPSKVVRRKNKEYFMYYEGNQYELFDKAMPGYDNGVMIDENIYGLFTTSFKMSFNDSHKESGVILIRDGKYLSVKMVSPTSFKVNLTDSSYNASIFTVEEANAIENLFNWNFKRREINNLLLNDLRQYNIYKDNTKTVLDEYKNIMKDITSKKTTVVGYKKPSELRLETEKGALEYLRRFYIKDVFDYKNLFEISLTDDIKSVLIVAPKLNLELQGLALAAKNKLNVCILNENKFGYLPHVYINNNINLHGVYRLKLQNLTKSFLDNYDMIVFGHSFDEEEEVFKDTLNSLIEDDTKMVFVNTRVAKFEEPNDKFYSYFSKKLDLKRKYFSYEMPYQEEVNKLDEEFTKYLYKVQSIYQFEPVRLEKEFSYHSIIIKDGTNLIDYYKK